MNGPVGVMIAFALPQRNKVATQPAIATALEARFVFGFIFLEVLT